jgi:hypothetical protein
MFLRENTHGHASVDHRARYTNCESALNGAREKPWMGISISRFSTLLAIRFCGHRIQKKGPYEFRFGIA